jgi:hypothetical protein
MPPLKPDCLAAVSHGAVRKPFSSSTATAASRSASILPFIYKFLSPDDQLLGLRIGGFDECGDVYNHPKYQDAVEQLERSTI